jgi:hypothetical protein
VERVERQITLNERPEEVFAKLDDHERLVAHMAGQSAMMGGGRMSLTHDGARGQAVGSRVSMSGRAFGWALSLNEEITRREPPYHKAWATIGMPRLVVLGPYRMGFDIAAVGDGSALTVWIDYEPATDHPWLARLFGGLYARWCVRRMLEAAGTPAPSP